MFEPDQISIGRGRRDTEAWEAALTVARELYAAGRWEGKGQLIVHFPTSLERQLFASGAERFDYRIGVQIHSGIHRLRRGTDYELELAPEASPDEWRQTQFFD